MNTPLSTVSARFVNAFLQATGVDARTREQLLRQAGIVPMLLAAPGTRVTEEHFACLYRALVAHLDDEMPGMLSRPLRRGTTRLLCLSLLDAPSLQAALHRYTRFHHMILDDFALVLERDAQAALAIVPAAGCAPPSALAQQLLLKFVHSLASWLAGQALPVLQARYAFAPPADAFEHGYLYPGPAVFDAPRSELRFPSAFMDVALARRQPEDVRRFLARAPAGWIFTTATASSVTQRVRDYLEHGAARARDIESVAEALHYSVRTLCRRLEAEGTSFRQVRDELRRDLAVQRLTRTSRSIAAIAIELGFEDATAFYRAFKHWTGSTPGAYRRNSTDAGLAASSTPPGGESQEAEGLPA